MSTPPLGARRSGSPGEPGHEYPGIPWHRGPGHQM